MACFQTHFSFNSQFLFTSEQTHKYYFIPTLWKKVYWLVSGIQNAGKYLKIENKMNTVEIKHGEIITDLSKQTWYLK